MQLLYDFLPIILFFAAYKMAGIFIATAVAMAAAIIQVTISWIRHRRVEPLHLISAGLIAVLGGVTLLLHDKTFVMWKPTAVYVLFAGAFAATQLFSRRPLIQRLIGAQLQLPEPLWRKLGWIWITFFLVCGAANAGFIRYYVHAEHALQAAVPTVTAQALNDLDCDADFSGATQALCEQAAWRENLWVNFKLFGLLILTAVFVVGQGLWLARQGFVPGQEPNPKSGDDSPDDSTNKHSEGESCSTQS